MAHKVLGAGVRIMSSGAGHVSERVHHLKEKHSKSPTVSEIDVTTLGADLPQILDHTHAEEAVFDVPPPYQENDEEQWQLDEAQDALTLNTEATLTEEERAKAVLEKQKSEKYNEHDPKAVFERFLERHPAPSHPATAKLSLPVIVPQRRPRDKTRGFIRAHALVLSKVGIDQAAFIDFLETFNQASLASPSIQVLNLASLIVGTVGHAPGIAKKNEPDSGSTQRILPATLVMTWRPQPASKAQAASSTTEVDLTSTITSSMPETSTESKFKRSMKLSDGKTYGDNAPQGFGFTDVAPLVFPQLDEIESKDPKAAKSKVQAGQGFVADYFDRRAMARYMATNPTSVLTTTDSAIPKYHSRYADPNHPAASGNLISFLSGGELNPPRLGQGLGDPNQQHWGIGWVANKIVIARNESKVKKAAALKEQELGDHPELQEVKVEEEKEKELTQRDIWAQRAAEEKTPDGRAGKEALGAIMGVLQPDVLYLMIVNMPSEEMAAAASAAKDTKEMQAESASIPTA
ncbi:uncharacterized protein PAC_20071 [Phialocephala subalpina]|uniref:Uncharacterized protein n=1 Tax=Phialocephala subalpina TaxID=576137 RepID=A0A1L7XYY2_9HELO|nr:uncharacterized protein PAC_20071 [Phialocephala subalpina]